MKGHTSGRRPHDQGISYYYVCQCSVQRDSQNSFATLNDLEVKSSDILNAYVQALVTEKVWTTLGAEFGKDARKTAVIDRAIYGLKSAVAAFRSHLTKCMGSLGHESCKADPDCKKIPHEKTLSCSGIEPERTITHDYFLTGIFNLLNSIFVNSVGCSVLVFFFSFRLF